MAQIHPPERASNGLAVASLADLAVRMATLQGAATLSRSRKGLEPMIAAQANDAKEELVFKVLHEQSPQKSGVIFWIGAIGETFFWHDLMRVSYDPSPDEESEERITMLFRLCDIIIQGINLRDLFWHCQTCRIDWLKTSSRDAILRGKGTIVTSIQIKEPKQSKGKSA